MTRERILVTVKAYPQPSDTYDELVCTAGIREDGSWVRIYPVPLHDLNFHKYDWIELDLIQRGSEDFRPESFRPKDHKMKDLRVIERLSTKDKWFARKKACLKKVYTNKDQLIKDSEAPENISLAAFKPTKLCKLIIENDDTDWPRKKLEKRKQINMFSKFKNRETIEKIPYRFKYEFEDDQGVLSKLSIEDWEIGMLYRNCLASAKGDKKVAIGKVRQKYETEFFTKDITLFLGTTLKHHRLKHTNPFTIIGVFYPPKETG